MFGPLKKKNWLVNMTVLHGQIYDQDSKEKQNTQTKLKLKVHLKYVLKVEG